MSAATPNGRNAVTDHDQTDPIDTLTAPVAPEAGPFGVLVDDLRRIFRVRLNEILRADLKLYTLRDVAELTGRGLRTLTADVAAGRLRYTHSFGERTNRISHAEVRRYIDEARVDG